MGFRPKLFGLVAGAVTDGATVLSLVVLSGGGLGLILAVIPIALCDYSGHGVFVADKRLELLILGLLVGACGGALRVGWQARGRGGRRGPVGHGFHR